MTDSQFDSDSAEQLEYRTVHPPAIIALLFGLASPLGLIAPLLLVIPLCGAVLAVVAWRRIERSAGALTGRGAAVAGLVLCVGFGVLSVSHAGATRYLRSRQAADFSRRWIALVQHGHLEQAFRLTSRGAAPPEEPDSGEPQEDPFARFSRHPLVLALRDLGDDSEIRFDGTLNYLAGPGPRYGIQQQHQVIPSHAESSTEPFLLTMYVQRTKPYRDDRWQWLVGNFSSDAYPISPEMP